MARNSASPKGFIFIEPPRVGRNVFSPHPEERPLGRVSKDGRTLSWFETREDALLTMRALL
jgi:hypothetical protein